MSSLRAARAAAVAIIALVVLGSIAWPATPARAATPLEYTTGPASADTGWTVAVVAVPVGAAVTFLNADAAEHDFVAAGAYGRDNQPWCKPGHYPKGRCPLFWSRLVGLGSSAPVSGLDRLVAGRTYTFVCTIHSSMRGTLLAVNKLG